MTFASVARMYSSGFRKPGPVAELLILNGKAGVVYASQMVPFLAEQHRIPLSCS